MQKSDTKTYVRENNKKKRTKKNEVTEKLEIARQQFEL